MPEKPAAIGAFACLILLAGCAGLPTAGPLTSEIVEQAGTATAQQLNYMLVDVTVPVSRALSSRPTASLRQIFGDDGPPVAAIGIGDTLTVTIWEAGQGGLFGAPPLPGQATSPSRGAVIADLVVAQDGMITIPYAGRIAVTGLAPAAAERAVVTSLTGRAVDPQVVVTVTRNISSSVTVSGEVATGARVALSVKGDRILDVVAAAGGIRIPVPDAAINLTRGNRTAGVPYEDLLADPMENIYLRGGDMLTVTRQPQSFTAFGALVSNAQVPFETRTITLEEAIAKVGGLSDVRADPAGVFVFRYETLELARQIGTLQIPSDGVTLIPVVYRLDFNDAGSYFLARQFVVRDKDMIYVANAPMTDVQKFFTAIGAALGPAATSAAVAASISAAN
jgi:polysaccharide export outer membrane protein